MRRLALLSRAAFLGAFITGCAEQPAPTGIGFGADDPPISFAKGDRPRRGGGFDHGGSSGSVEGTDWFPRFWPFARDIGENPQFEPKCGRRGHCSVGNLVQSFAGLNIPSNPDANPVEDTERVSRRFAVISTTNFFRDIDEDSRPELIVTNQSAIRRSFILPAGGWQLQVDLAFLTGEKGATAQNDFATIALTSSGRRVKVIRLEADDSLDWKPGGCGKENFGGVITNYRRCTDWTPYSVDVSKFGYDTIDVEVEIRVGEGGIDNGVATTLAIDNVKFVPVNLLPAVGPITLSPSSARAGSAVQATAEFTDGDATDAHHAVWSWGDGTRTNPGNLTQGPGFGSVTNSHTYSRPGTYTMILSVTDDDGGRGTTRRQITVLDR